MTKRPPLIMLGIGPGARNDKLVCLEMNRAATEPEMKEIYATVQNLLRTKQAATEAVTS